VAGVAAPIRSRERRPVVNGDAKAPSVPSRRVGVGRSSPHSILHFTALSCRRAGTRFEAGYRNPAR
jgi:hypothetical protein